MCVHNYVCVCAFLPACVCIIMCVSVCVCVRVCVRVRGSRNSGYEPDSQSSISHNYTVRILALVSWLFGNKIFQGAVISSYILCWPFDHSVRGSSAPTPHTF